jgi:hypothetical protein
VAEYRIICVVRNGRGQPAAVGYSERGSAVMYDDTWTIEEAKRALEQGHRLYRVNPVTGVEADLQPTDEGVDMGLLGDLPNCSG